MNVIQERRDDVKKNYNTAQKIFLNILNGLNPNDTEEIRITQSLHGDIDLSVLNDRGFKKVKAILFDRAGEITELYQLWKIKTLEILVCREQLLDSLDLFPPSIVEIDLTHNYLTSFKTPETPKLRVLRLSNNRIKSIPIKLPSSLEEIYLDNNELTRLDLSSTQSLKTLHVSNNPLLVVERLPPTISDFVMENTPSTVVQQDIRGTSRNEDTDDTMNDPNSATKKSADEKYDYIESIREYFRLKKAYELKLHNMKKTAYYKGANKKESIYNARSVKPPCINCKRPVGTVFAIKNERYTAVCGDKTQPCNLNIQIFNGDYMNLDNLLTVYKETLEDSKQTIIQQKLDTLFNYVDEQRSVAMFKEEMKEFNETSEMYQTMKDNYADIHDNKARILSIKRKTDEMYRLREQIGLLMNEYETSGNRHVLTTAMEIHVRELMPVITQLRMLKYDVMLVDHQIKGKGSGSNFAKQDDAEKDEDADLYGVMCKLVQREVAYHKNDFMFGEGPRVIKFVAND
jgi:Leucine-rich repeat (LRR) protein